MRIATNATMEGKTVYVPYPGLNPYGIAVYATKDGNYYCLVKWEN